MGRKKDGTCEEEEVCNCIVCSLYGSSSVQNEENVCVESPHINKYNIKRTKREENLLWCLR